MQLKPVESGQFSNFSPIGHPDEFDWNLDDYVLKDLPAIIDTVKSHTGHSRVIWIGHSMGGMVMYCYLERARRNDVAAFVAVASPVAMSQPANDHYRRALEHRDLILLGRALFNVQLPGSVGSWTGKLPDEAFRCNPRNMDVDVNKAVYRYALEDVSSALLLQLEALARTGHLKSADAKFDYTAELGRVRTPILCISGKIDNVCEPANVRFAYEHVGSTDKTYREIGLANGFSADYGHLDLVLGRNAPRDVYPLIRDWIAHHDRS